MIKGPSTCRKAVIATDPESDMRRVVSVHKNLKLADRAWVKNYNAAPDIAFGIADCPVGKRRGDLLTFDEIMSCSEPALED